MKTTNPLINNSRLYALPSIALTLGVAALANAQELITNGNFTGNLTGWSPTDWGTGGSSGLNANGPEADLAPTLAAAPGGGLVLALRHRQQVRWRKGENEAILTRGEGDVRFPIAVALLGDEGLRWLAAPRRSPASPPASPSPPRVRRGRHAPRFRHLGPRSKPPPIMRGVRARAGQRGGWVRASVGQGAGVQG